MNIFRDRYRIVEYTHSLHLIRFRVGFRPWYGFWEEIGRAETKEEAQKIIDSIVNKEITYYQ